MGEKTKMSLGLLVCLLVFMTGCERPPRKPPKIRVERMDSSEWSGVTVYFDHHYYDQQNGVRLTLNTPEEVAAYREEVEFLLDRLEEAEVRMNVHEPEPIQP